MREIDRYERASPRERVLGALGWFRSHRIAGAIVVLFALGWIAQLLAPQRPATPADLAVGDCLYARTSAWMDTGPDARPIGPEGDVEAIVMAGQAERAGCEASHGHEVSALVPLPSAAAMAPGRGGSVEAASGSGAPAPGSGVTGMPGVPVPSAGAGGADPLEAIRPAVQRRCDDAFEGYVGKAESGSIYETFAALPTFAQWQAGEALAVCLVARRDGHWMAYPARGSRQ